MKLLMLALMSTALFATEGQSCKQLVDGLTSYKSVEQEVKQTRQVTLDQAIVIRKFDQQILQAKLKVNELILDLASQEESMARQLIVRALDAPQVILSKVFQKCLQTPEASVDASLEQEFDKLVDEINSAVTTPTSSTQIAKPDFNLI